MSHNRPLQKRRAMYGEEHLEERFSDNIEQMEEMDMSETEMIHSEEDRESDFEEDEDSQDEEDGYSSEELQKIDRLKNIQRSLAHVPFAKLAEIQDKIGMKQFIKVRRLETHKKVEDDNDEEIESKANMRPHAKDLGHNPKARNDMKRESKNAPIERSSKKRTGRFRHIVDITSKKTRDPRFDQLSGKLNLDLFEKSYSFLNDYKTSEFDQLRKEIKNARGDEEKERLSLLFTKMQSRDAAAQNEIRRKQLLRERKKAEMRLVQNGKKPFHLKKSEEKKMMLVDKFKQLKEKENSKGLKKVLEKRRKKNAAKEHRRVPFKRRGIDV